MTTGASTTTTDRSGDGGSNVYLGERDGSDQTRIPYRGTLDLLSNPDPEFRDRINDLDHCDCDDLARAFYRASGYEGQILDLTVPRGEIKVREMGNLESFVDHRTYTDGSFVFDPRYSDEPIPMDQYMDELKSLNPDMVIKDITPN